MRRSFVLNITARRGAGDYGVGVKETTSPDRLRQVLKWGKSRSVLIEHKGSACKRRWIPRRNDADRNPDCFCAIICIKMHPGTPNYRVNEGNHTHSQGDTSITLNPYHNTYSPSPKRETNRKRIDACANIHLKPLEVPNRAKHHPQFFQFSQVTQFRCTLLLWYKTY